MDIKFTKKRTHLLNLLSRLSEAITDYEEECKTLDLSSEGGQRTARTYRDSMLKRFELAIDHLWKILKLYMEGVGITLEELSPKSITRTAALHRIITEAESAQLIEMIKALNQTSHIYREEVADEIAKQSPNSLVLMEILLDRLNKKIDGDKARQS